MNITIEENKLDNFLTINQKVKIVPDDINSVSIALLKNIEDNQLILTLDKGNWDNYKKGQMLECYSLTGKGFIYFIAEVFECGQENLILTNFSKIDCLQRRAHERVRLNKQIIISTGDITHNIELVDLSAGGLKLITNDLLNIDLIYSLVLNLEKNKSIVCKFKTLKLEALPDKKYSIQGTFVDLDNADVVAISQYCKKKLLEQLSK